MIQMKEMESVLRIIEDYSKKVSTDLKIRPEEFKQRHASLQERMAQRGLDYGLFFWYREMPGDGIYLTNYNPTIERASGVISSNRAPLILAGPEAGKLAEETSAPIGVAARFVEEFSIPEEYYEGLDYPSIREVLQEYDSTPARKVGILTSRDIFPEEILDVFRGAFQGAEFVDASDILRDLRYEKSLAEFECMKQADTIASAAVRAMLTVLRPGLRETEVAAVGDFVIKSLGGDGYGFETIVTAGKRCRSVIGPASNRVMREGEIVQVGCSPSYQGYKGVCRRVVVLGEMTLTQRAYFKLLKEAYDKAEEALRSVAQEGAAAKLVDTEPRTYFEKFEIDGENMRKFHMYSAAHGTGLTECLEPMVITPTTEKPYGNRVGVMIDLGSYGHPNDEIAGGCIENAFGKDGAEVYRWTDLPDDVNYLVGKAYSRD